MIFNSKTKLITLHKFQQLSVVNNTIEIYSLEQHIGMKCIRIQYMAVQHNAIQYYIALYNIVHYNEVHYSKTN